MKDEFAENKEMVKAEVAALAKKHNVPMPGFDFECADVHKYMISQGWYNHEEKAIGLWWWAGYPAAGPLTRRGVWGRSA